MNACITAEDPYEPPKLIQPYTSPSWMYKEAHKGGKRWYINNFDKKTSFEDKLGQSDGVNISLVDV